MDKETAKAISRGGDIIAAREMARIDADIEWILNDDINLEIISTGVKVSDRDGRECVLTYHAEPGAGHGILRFDGRYVDVGDDFPRFLGIMDAAAEGVTFIGDCLNRPLP